MLDCLEKISRPTINICLAKDQHVFLYHILIYRWMVSKGTGGKCEMMPGLAIHALLFNIIVSCMIVQYYQIVSYFVGSISSNFGSSPNYV
jgi:hypothetical protein